MQDFRKLIAWQKAHALSLRADALADSIRRKKPALASQIERAADSIAANIAEGSAAMSDPEYARFLTMSIRSTTEYENHMERGHGGKVIPTREYSSHVADVIEVRKILIGLRKAVLGRKTKPDDSQPKD